MHLIIKNAEAANVNAASIPHRLEVDIDGVEVDDLLIHVDVTDAINYYGITELLDTIGEDQLRLYLKRLPCTVNGTGT